MTTEQAKRRRIWSWVCVGVAFACLAINLTLLWHTSSRWQQIDQREQEIASIQKDLDELASLQKALDEFKAEAHGFKAEAHGDVRGLDHDAKRQQLKQKLEEIEQRLAKLSDNRRRAEPSSTNR